MVPDKQFELLLRTFVLLSFVIAFAALVILTSSGWIAPFAGRFYSLWDTGYAKVHSRSGLVVHGRMDDCKLIEPRSVSSHHRLGLGASTYRLAVVLL